MEQSNKKRNRLPKWSELCPDLVQCVFERLSFTNLKRAQSVCRSWNSASRSCVPKRNQIPWLILFPRYEEETNSNSNSNSNRCGLFVPEDKKKVYKTRDLGVGFTQSSCLATHGSWLLMFDHLLCNLYILNPLTLERIDLPRPPSFFSKIFEQGVGYNIGCLWVDDITKDYLVVWIMAYNMVFTKKGDDTWRNVSPSGRYDSQIVYNHKDDKVYTYAPFDRVYVWDFSGDIPRQDEHLVPIKHSSFMDSYCYLYSNFKACIATTVSGQLLHVCYYSLQGSKYKFYIFKLDRLRQKWVQVDSLGDEALILDMGFTVIANDISGIKRNSIYFSGLGNGRNDPFVYDLTTRTMEFLSQCVYSSIHFSHARWFFPDLAL